MHSLVLCDQFKIQEIACLATANGCGIEVDSFYLPEVLTGEPDAIATHREAMTGIPLRSMHGPFADLCPGSMDPMVSAVARNRYELAVKIAPELGITHIVFHHGYVPGTSTFDGWLSRCSLFWHDFLKSVPDSITIHLENQLEHDPALLVAVVDSVASPHLDICLDIGHAHCFSKHSVTDWIDQLGHRIGYVHLHDNHGDTDEHLGLGQGSIPMNDVCSALEGSAPDAVWAVESQIPFIGQSIAWLKANGFVD